MGAIAPVVVTPAIVQIPEPTTVLLFWFSIVILFIIGKK